MSEKPVADEQKTKLYEQNVKLCRAVQAQRCVYDRDSNCQKQECNDTAWETIAKECDDTVKSCKLRWHNIRFAFMRSLQRHSKKRPSNRLRDYYLYEDLIFLLPHLAFATDSKTTDSENDDSPLATRKHLEITKLEATPNSMKEEMSDKDTAVLKTSADEAVSDEQKTPPTIEKTQINKPSEQVKPSKIGSGKQDESKDILPATSRGGAAIKDNEKRNFRFRRACKRGLDKNVVQQLCDMSPKRDIQAKRSRRSSLRGRSSLKSENNSETKTVNKSPIKEVEAPKKQKVTQVTSLKSAEKAPAVKLPPLPQSQKFVYNVPESIEPAKLLAPPEQFLAMREQASQCDTVTDIWDDEFLNSLRPQMAAMNLRQKLNFKQKVYLSLMDVFDDAAKFPGSNENTSIALSPPPIENAATTAEMLLIRELVSMVQAAKSVPEIMSQPTIQKVTENSFDAQPNVKIIDSTEATTSAQAEAAQKTPTWRLAEATRPHIVRKIFKTNSDGTFTTQESAKPRIYRILPKSTSGAFKQTTSNGSVGTFIIPRVPASIASSVNAAAAAAAAAETAEKNQVLPNKVYRQIPVSGRTLLVSESQAASVENSAPGGRRTVTIRNTEGSTGTFAPRQIFRRYSICGAGGNVSDLPGAINKIITTSASLTPQLNLRNSTVFSSALTPTRLVRATTTTTPFKVPTAAATSVTQSLKTKTTPAAVNLSSNAAPFTLSTSPVKIPIGTMGAMQNFSINKSNTSSSYTLSNKKTPPKPQNTTVTEKQTKNLPKFSVADTAGTIASDNFGSFNIKNEPMD